MIRNVTEGGAASLRAANTGPAGYVLQRACQPEPPTVATSFGAPDKQIAAAKATSATRGACLSACLAIGRRVCRLAPGAWLALCPARPIQPLHEGLHCIIMLHVAQRRSSLVTMQSSIPHHSGKFSPIISLSMPTLS